jgi:putative resolvase
MSYITSKKACAELGIHPNTLRNWEKQGKIKAIRSPSNQRMYDISTFNSMDKAKIIYARVSSSSQKADLESQIAYLKNRYPTHELIEDIGSGLNFKRKGLKTLLERVMSGDVAEIVISHRDRLCRFGFELIEFIAEKHNCKIVVLDNTALSPQGEMVKDLISIIHVFSCRLYGLRKYSRQIKEDLDLSKESTTCT